MVLGEGQAQRNYITDSMTRTHHDIETMTRRLELEKRRLQRIEKELAAAQRTYQVRVLGHESSKTSKRGPQSARERHNPDGEISAGGSSVSTAMAGPTKALLNRLDVQRKKLNSMDHENVVLREEIDSIRRRRLQLNTIFDRLKVDIKQRSAQLADFVEETAASKTVHGDANQRVDVMKRHRELERRQFKQEVLRLREQLKLQDWERKEIEVHLKRADTGVQKKKELIIPEEETSFSEAEMMRRIMKTAFLNCIQRRHIKQHQKSIEVFEQAFSTIKQSTGIEHIEEIVKIFVNLESRNFSLLTYVNVMSREIEALEGIRREHYNKDETKNQAEARYKQARQEALEDNIRQLNAAQESLKEGYETITLHKELFEEILPILSEISQRIQREFEKLRAAGSSPPEEMLRFPGELREDTLPEWLEMVETALGRFRELLPGSSAQKDGAFPCTALVSVRSLQPKRMGAQVQVQPLVKAQDLPSSLMAVEDQGNPAQKRAHAQMTASQKAELLDDESEEEDFDNRPLKFKEVRKHAEQSAARRKRRGANKRDQILQGSLPVRGESNKHLEERGMSPTSTYPPRAPSRAGAGEMGFERDDDLLEDNSSGTGTDKGAGGFIESPQDKHYSLQGAGISSVSTSPSPRKLGRGPAACQVVRHDTPEVSEEEINKCFLHRYKMTREELQVMADHMQIHIHNLCFLKQEFDQYDPGQSGVIDSTELKKLLKKLGEELSDDELDPIFKLLDSDNTGEIEFFEFCQWFTSDA